MQCYFTMQIQQLLFSLYINSYKFNSFDKSKQFMLPSLFAHVYLFCLTLNFHVPFLERISNIHTSCQYTDCLLEHCKHVKHAAKKHKDESLSHFCKVRPHDDSSSAHCSLSRHCSIILGIYWRKKKSTDLYTFANLLLVPLCINYKKENIK